MIYFFLNDGICKKAIEFTPHTNFDYLHMWAKDFSMRLINLPPLLPINILSDEDKNQQKKSPSCQWYGWLPRTCFRFFFFSISISFSFCSSFAASSPIQLTLRRETEFAAPRRCFALRVSEHSQQHTATVIECRVMWHRWAHLRWANTAMAV